MTSILPRKVLDGGKGDAIAFFSDDLLLFNQEALR